MDETRYRESRLCRLLGNPVIYQIVVLLNDGGAMTPSRLAKLVGRSVQTVSGHLAKLRSADIVRYDSAGKEVRYWLKHKGETAAALKALERIVEASGRLVRSCEQPAFAMEILNVFQWRGELAVVAGCTRRDALFDELLNSGNEFLLWGEKPKFTNYYRSDGRPTFASTAMAQQKKGGKRPDCALKIL